jgi:hypothetical protein
VEETSAVGGVAKKKKLLNAVKHKCNKVYVNPMKPNAHLNII